MDTALLSLFKVVLGFAYQSNTRLTKCLLVLCLIGSFAIVKAQAPTVSYPATLTATVGTTYTSAAPTNSNVAALSYGLQYSGAKIRGVNFGAPTVIQFANNTRIDAEGNLYGILGTNFDVWKWTKSTGVTSILRPARGYYFQDLVIDAAGNIYLGGKADGYVIKIPVNGPEVQINTRFERIRNMCFDKAGNLFLMGPLANGYTYAVDKLAPGSYTPTPTTYGSLNGADGMATDYNGNLIMCNSYGPQIGVYKCKPDGGIEPITFKGVQKIYIDGGGNAYIYTLNAPGATPKFSTIEMVPGGLQGNFDNTILVYADTKYRPAGFAIDKQGSFYTVAGPDFTQGSAAGVNIYPYLVAYDPIGGYFTDDLPQGLKLNGSTGVISGVATTPQASKPYNIYSYNSGKPFTKTVVNIAVEKNYNLKLATLTSQGPAFTQIFSPDAATFSTQYNNQVLSVQATAADATSSILIGGQLASSPTRTVNVNLNLGENRIPVVVTSNDGLKSQTYTIIATRAKNQDLITGVPASLTKAYGDANFYLAGSTVSGRKPVLTSNNTAVAVINADQSIRVISPGTATIKANLPANDNYTAAAEAATQLTVAPAKLYYTATPVQYTYGDFYYSSPTGSITGLVNGDMQSDVISGYPYFSTSVYSRNNVGDYAIQGSGVLLKSTNYTLEQNPANSTAIRIVPRVVTVKVNPATRKYGEDNIRPTVSATNLASGDRIDSYPFSTYLSISNLPGKTSAPGVYNVYIGYDPVFCYTTNYYVIQPAPYTTYTVTKGELKYSAIPVTKTYGDATPALTGIITGFANGEKLETATTGTPIFNTTTTQATGAGAYAITGSGLFATNYNIIQAPANNTALTINKSKLQYTATPASKKANAANPQFAGEITGFVNGETLATATTGSAVFATTATVAQTNQVGTYDILGSGLSSANYDFEQAPANANAFAVIQSANSKLSNIAISAGTLSPVFNDEVNNYSVNVDHATTAITVTPTTADANAHVTVNGTQVASGTAAAPVSLSYGVTAIHINVTAEDGSTIDPYTIEVSRALSHDNSIASVTATQGAASEVSQGQYTLFLNSIIRSTELTVNLTDPDATVKFQGQALASGAPVTVPIKSDYNQFFFEVTAQDGTVKNYVANVVCPRSSNNLLTSLDVNPGTLNRVFDSSIAEYNLTVSSATDSLNVTAITADTAATLLVGGYQAIAGSPMSVKLNTGLNNIGVTVLAENNSQNNYTIKVTKEPSADASLASLGLDNRTLPKEFSATDFSYTDEVDNSQTYYKIHPLAANANATVTANGEVVNQGSLNVVQLALGNNPINIVVTAEDGTTTQTYTLNVNRPLSSNAQLADLVFPAQGPINEVFDTNVYHYTATIADATVNGFFFTPTASDAFATISTPAGNVISGQAAAVQIHGGFNTIPVEVLAPDGTKKTYTIDVTRAQSSNANLAAVLVTSKDRQNNYTINLRYRDPLSVNVPYKVDGVTILPVAEDEGDRIIRVNGAVIPLDETTIVLDLQPGDNSFDINITSGDGTVVKDYTLHINRLPYVDVDLKSLVVNKGTLKPAFSPDVINYTLLVGSGDASLDLTPVASSASVTVNTGASTITAQNPTATTEIYAPLFAGYTQTILTTVTAADGVTRKLYRVKVTRPLDNANLSDIGVSAGTLSPAFDSNLQTYTNTVDYAVSNIMITPVTPETGSVIKVNGITVDAAHPGANIPLTPGDNAITVAVTSAGGLTNSYTLNVTRGAASYNALLYEIGTHGGVEIAEIFDPAKTEYTAFADNTINSMLVLPAAQDVHATIKINGKDMAQDPTATTITLNSGVNNIITEVTAQDGITKKTYTLTINKALSNAAWLTKIGLDPGAALIQVTGPSDQNYTASVGSAVNNVRLILTAQAGATIKVNGQAVTSGSPSQSITLTGASTAISALVTAEDGVTSHTYTITINKPTLSNLAWLTGISLDPGGTLVPVSGPSDQNFTASVGLAVNSVRLILTAQAGATIKVNGQAVTSGSPSQSITLTGTSTAIAALVTAEDGVTTHTYTITVNKPALSNAAWLTKISLDPDAALARVSGPSDQNYTALVGPAVNSIRLLLTAQAGATIKVNGQAVTGGSPSQSIALTGSSTMISALVTAEDGITSHTYTITVNKQAFSNAAWLTKIGLDPGAALTRVNGLSDQNYTASVSSAVNSVRLILTAQEHATITVNGQAVSSGTASQSIALTGTSTVIAALVTAEDGTTTHTYAITVNKTTLATSNIVDNNKILKENKQDLNGPTPATLAINVHQAVSPNGDGINDALMIEGIEQYPDNKVLVMNRSGEVIFTAAGYNNSSTAFDGHGSNGKLQQPGTYFYSLEYKQGNSTQRKTGYIVLKY